MPIEWKAASEYESHREDAERHIAKRDPDDWPTIALALKLHLPVWTQLARPRRFPVRCDPHCRHERPDKRAGTSEAYISHAETGRLDVRWHTSGGSCGRSTQTCASSPVRSITPRVTIDRHAIAARDSDDTLNR